VVAVVGVRVVVESTAGVVEAEVVEVTAGLAGSELARASATASSTAASSSVLRIHGPSARSRNQGDCHKGHHNTTHPITHLSTKS
jgi:hypothetical protein